MPDYDDAPDLPEDDPDDSPDLRSDDEEERATTSKPIEAVEDIAKQYSAAVSRLYEPIIKGSLPDFQKMVAANIFPNIKATNLLLPELELSIPTINPAVFGIGKILEGVLQQQQAIFSPWLTAFEQNHRQWNGIFSRLGSIADAFFPPNWKGVNYPEIESVEVILLDEGIPLAWVPGPEILQAVFDARDAAARRRVISSRWKGVVSDCDHTLNEVSHQKLRRHVPFAMDIVHALRAGHPSGAQALAANMLDSILRGNFDKKFFKTVTTNKKDGDRFELDDYVGRAAFTLAPIWRAYAEYWESQGDPIPRTFGRHPSAHAVSRTQYSRVNAVIGLMLVTSLLKLLDSQLA
jgi:hypothetical protein